MRALEVNRRIERLGGEHMGARGSHRHYRVRYGDGGTVRTAVPIHPGDIAKGTLRKIERTWSPRSGRGG
jgi:predicted RNA binding protein YcfA (HicA-like mRNA interferase family)